MQERGADGLKSLTPKQQNYVRNGHRMAQRHPQGARLFSDVNRALIRLTGGRLGGTMQGVQVGLLTTTGRRSGTPSLRRELRSCPVRQSWHGAGRLSRRG